MPTRALRGLRLWNALRTAGLQFAYGRNSGCSVFRGRSVFPHLLFVLFLERMFQCFLFLLLRLANPFVQFRILFVYRRRFLCSLWHQPFPIF